MAVGCVEGQRGSADGRVPAFTGPAVWECSAPPRLSPASSAQLATIINVRAKSCLSIPAVHGLPLGMKRRRASLASPRQRCLRSIDSHRLHHNARRRCVSRRRAREERRPHGFESILGPDKIAEIQTLRVAALQQGQLHVAKPGFPSPENVRCSSGGARWLRQMATPGDCGSGPPPRLLLLSRPPRCARADPCRKK